jgi:uncharacterized protein YcbK (DUF882 family)
VAEKAKENAGFELSRRRFIAAGIASLACLGPLPALAHSRKVYARSVSFRHLHTDESLNVVYWEQGEYVPEALKQVNRLLRDFRTGDVKRIDPRLLDLLYAMGRRLGTSKPFQVVSGYRSPATNAMLRRNSKKVAKSSFHMQGKAVDVRLSGFAPRTLAQLARGMGAGGVGFYPRSNFIHLDVGPVRYWRG